MKRLSLLVLALGLGGCMAPANPPSLAPRAIEMRSEAVIPKAPVPEAKPIDAPLSAKISALLAEVRNGDAEFTQAEAAGARAIASGQGAAEGSEAWISAQQHLSALQTARQRSAAALSELDSLSVVQANASASDPSLGGLSDVQTAQANAEAVVARQTARLEALTR